MESNEIAEVITLLLLLLSDNNIDDSNDDDETKNTIIEKLGNPIISTELGCYWKHENIKISLFTENKIADRLRVSIKLGDDQADALMKKITMNECVLPFYFDYANKIASFKGANWDEILSNLESSF